MSDPIPYAEENITPVIYYLRSEKVMLDRDLAILYGIETKRLKEAVRRNIERFPSDFMFELTDEELQNWRTQFASSNSEKKGLRYNPMAFTEQGIAMLSSVLNAPRAIEVNIAIMRTFVKLRKLMLKNVELSEKMRELEAAVVSKFTEQDEKFDILFDAIRSLTEQPPVPRRPIGFNESNVKYGKSTK